MTGNHDVVTCQYLEDAAALSHSSESDVLAASKSAASRLPMGSGPWPFVVVRTRGIGLKVRTTPLPMGEQIGSLSELDPVWVTCRRDSDFDPDPSTGNGPIWFQVTWSDERLGSDFRHSQYTAASTGWAYGGYLVPIGQDGEVPDC